MYARANFRSRALGAPGVRNAPKACDIRTNRHICTYWLCIKIGLFVLSVQYRGHTLVCDTSPIVYRRYLSWNCDDGLARADPQRLTSKREMVNGLTRQVER